MLEIISIYSFLVISFGFSNYLMILAKTKLRFIFIIKVGINRYILK